MTIALTFSKEELEDLEYALDIQVKRFEDKAFRASENLDEEIRNLYDRMARETRELRGKIVDARLTL